MELSFGNEDDNFCAFLIIEVFPFFVIFKLELEFLVRFNKIPSDILLKQIRKRN